MQKNMHYGADAIDNLKNILIACMPILLENTHILSGRYVIHINIYNYTHYYLYL